MNNNFVNLLFKGPKEVERNHLFILIHWEHNQKISLWIFLDALGELKYK